MYERKSNALNIWGNCPSIKTLYDLGKQFSKFFYLTSPLTKSKVGSSVLDRFECEKNQQIFTHIISKLPYNISIFWRCERSSWAKFFINKGSSPPPSTLGMLQLSVSMKKCLTVYKPVSYVHFTNCYLDGKNFSLQQE